MLITSVCSTCTKTTIMIVNSGMVATKAFYPSGWNVLYNANSASSTVSCICSRDCMQLYVNKMKAPNAWVSPDGSEEVLNPIYVH